jgi:alkylation response protein AidB-like acyl-CoA dehydrogenase
VGGPAPHAGSADAILAAARALAPAIDARAGETAAARRLPADLVAGLKQAGVFRMPMPRAWGGPEMTPREQLEVVEVLSVADPSVGWCAMIGSDGGFYGALLDEAAARLLFSDLDGVTAGLLQPAGRAARVPGGYRVSGRWGFGSGCTHADVMVGGCLVFDGDAPVLSPRGLPEWRVMLAPAASWQVLDTWHTTGLAGSGSNDYVTNELFVPEEHSFSLFDPPRRREPLYRFNGMFFANMHGVPLGLARRAIDVVRRLAGEKRSLPELVLLKDLPRVRAALARAEMELGAARAYAYETMDVVWEALRRDGSLRPEVRLALGLSRVRAFRTAREVAQLMVDTAGTSAIYQSSPLDRLLRDAITMSQHVVAQERMLEMLGMLAVGDESPVPFL